MSNLKHCSFRDCGFWDGLQWIWNFQWCRNLFQWELDLLHEMHSILTTVKLNRFAQDRIIWKFDNKRVFLVNSAARTVIAKKEQTMEVNSFTKAVRKGLVPPKVEIFAWFLLIGRVNTKSKLHRFGILQQN